MVKSSVKSYARLCDICRKDLCGYAILATSFLRCDCPDLSRFFPPLLLRAVGCLLLPSPPTRLTLALQTVPISSLLCTGSAGLDARRQFLRYPAPSVHCCAQRAQVSAHNGSTWVVVVGHLHVFLLRQILAVKLVLRDGNGLEAALRQLLHHFGAQLALMVEEGVGFSQGSGGERGEVRGKRGEWRGKRREDGREWKRCGDATMRRCEDAKTRRRHEDEKMRRRREDEKKTRR